MKIGIFSPYLDTMTGGEKYILTIASFLSQRNEVNIFWNNKDVLKEAEKKFNLDLQHVRIVSNIFTQNTSIFARFIKTMKYDAILYLSDGSIPLVGSKKLFLHFQFPVEWLAPQGVISKMKIKRVSAFICNSNYTKKFIDRKFNVNSYVLYPPAKINTKKIEQKENVILTVGRFSLLPNGEDFKKISVLLSAFKEFQKKRLKDWKFVIVTSFREEQRTEFEEFKKNIKNSYVEVHENISHSKIQEMYLLSKIYWHAAGFNEDIDKYPERAEHFGISTVEAMSYGSVPVVINAGGQKEIVEDGVNGYLWDNTDELVSKTHLLAINDTLWENLSKKSISSSQRFSEDRFRQELLQVIK